MTSSIQRSPFTKANDVDISQRETVFQGYFTMYKYYLRHRRFNGGWCGPMTRELFQRGEVAAVIPYDPVTDSVVLLEQFRIGALEDPHNPWLIELIAGAAEPGESLTDLAIRECQEEANLTVLDLLPVCTYWVSPGVTSERVHVYCGRVQAPIQGGVYGLEDEFEDIRSFVTPAKEAFSAVKQGIISNASTIIALQWLELNIEMIKQRWS